MAKNWISKLPPSIKLKILKKKKHLKISSISLYSAINKLPKIGFRSFLLVLNEKSLRKKETISKSVQFLYIAQLKHGQKLDFEASP